ncbi:MAG: saccharopine dehydrogenase NADP-binding domain-containing protein [Candidatus Schekmanbacteria bacterium]|nr:saccharopine dehydrogenase NADP-binding domain-containing protein [Candidatus Schekmanbacteria bacterium]
MIDEAEHGARIVLFGATGYTGRLTAEAMVARGLRPLLLGRSRQKVEALARELGGLGHGVADVERPAELAGHLRSGDVLVTTVGPFSRHGQVALAAAVAAGAHYVDSTGEIGFARTVVETYDAPARDRGIALLTTSGYDFVPGHCAAAEAVRRSQGRARRVDVGYFGVGDGPLGLSEGTRASMAEVSLAPGVFWEGGRLTEHRAGHKVRRFDVAGRSRPAVAISSSEALFLPRLFPDLRDLTVYLGWFGELSYLMPAASLVTAAVQRLPLVHQVVGTALRWTLSSSGRGPGPDRRERIGSYIVAETYDGRGDKVAEAALSGVNGYTFTANILALLAERAAAGRIFGTGAISPITALGLDGLIEACADAGLTLA